MEDLTQLSQLVDSAVNCKAATLARHNFFLKVLVANSSFIDNFQCPYLLIRCVYPLVSNIVKQVDEENKQRV